MKEAPRISVAIPLFNEEEGVSELLERVDAVLRELPGGPHEIVLTDDGSSDGTVEAVRRRLAGMQSSVVVVRLSRNFGHQPALAAAHSHASGDVVVLMDGDLQDPPETIPAFLERYREGYDVVFAVRAEREAPWYLRAAYSLFYRVAGGLSSIDLPLDSGDFSLVARPVVDVMKSAPEHHRYLRGLRTWAGFRQAGLPIHRPARARGKSKYSFVKLAALAFDGILSFSEIPLRVATAIGSFTMLGAVLFAIYSIYARFVLNRSPQGFTALILAIVFLAGVQMLFLGIIGEYVGRIHTEVKHRPQYVVREIIRK